MDESCSVKAVDSFEHPDKIAHFKHDYFFQKATSFLMNLLNPFQLM